MKNKTYKIYTRKGYITVILGKIYEGEGYSGMSDGCIVKGVLIEYDVMLDSALLQDDKNCMLHAVIPSTLKES